VLRTFICGNCKKEVTLDGKHWKRFDKKFCSSDCKNKFVRGENDPKYSRITKECPVCHELFRIKRCLANEIKTCGKGSCRREYRSLTQRRENSPAWKGGITPVARALRMCLKMKEWRDAVFKRDDYRDWFSGCHGQLEAHHIVPLSKLIREYHITTIEDAEKCDALWDTNNGITLLISSHKFIHDCWG
jgi:hypothetical protein